MRVNPTGTRRGPDRLRTATARATRRPSRRSSPTELGIPIDNVEIVHGDTDKVQFGMGTYGSRSAGGRRLGDRQGDRQGRSPRPRRSPRIVLEAAEDDIDFEDGEFTVAGTDKAIDRSARWRSTAYVAAQAARRRWSPASRRSAFYDPTNFTFPAGCYICEVEVDPDDRQSSIVRSSSRSTTSARVINPMIVEGQVHGGIAQGIGQALLGARGLRRRTASWSPARSWTTRMPRADDRAARSTSHDHDTPCPTNPLGVKGCGEAGAIGASAAVINAVTDAIGHNRLEIAGDARTASGTRCH
ncbi:MAG: molybdopterin-dependent oxidoreductase [Rhodopseudomonas palustris]|nr:molybdopterin-dependent oxidoreductase [Rhodopseudomonas palustris]